MQNSADTWNRRTSNLVPRDIHRYSTCTV